MINYNSLLCIVYNIFLFQKDLIQSVKHRWLGQKNRSTPNRKRTYEVLVTSPDALPLSYGGLVGAKITVVV